MRTKKVLVELSVAATLAAAWVAACYLVARAVSQEAGPFQPGWQQTAAWDAWWVGPVAGAASLLVGALAGLSGVLGADRPARILLRAAFVAAGVAVCLGVLALRAQQAPPRPPRLAPDDFFLSYARTGSDALSQTGPNVLLAVASLVALTTLGVALYRAGRPARGGSPETGVSRG